MTSDAHDYAYYECEFADELINRLFGSYWMTADFHYQIFPRQIIGGLKDAEMLQLLV